MSASELVRQGDLDGALEALQSQVRAEPAEVKHRIFLFQLLAVLGRWERAVTQLDVVGEMDSGNLPMVVAYREAIRNEFLRREIWAGRHTPLVFGEPEEWVAWMIQAVKLDADGQSAEAATLRERAFDAAPTSAGSADGQAFAWIADGDTRLGPILEALVEAKLYWIPFHRIARLTIQQPEDLRDMIWIPATFTWTNGGETMGLLPVRYPGSDEAGDPAIRLARRTEWNEAGENVWHGAGQRMWSTDAGDHAILDTREIVLGDG